MKCKLISGVIASALLTLSGCSTIDSQATNPSSGSELLVIQKGASLQTATTYLASVYGLKTINWDRKIDRSDYRLAHDVKINKLNSAQMAIDSVYNVIPHLYASVDTATNQINVTLNDVTQATSKYANKTGFDVIPVKSNAVVISKKHSSNLDSKQKQIIKKKVAAKPHVALDTKQKGLNNSMLMTGNDSMKIAAPVVVNKHLVTVEKGIMLSRTLMNDFSMRGFNVVWSVDEKVATAIHQPLDKSVSLNFGTVDQLADSAATILSSLSKETVHSKVFASSKQVVFYIGAKNNISLFNTTEGRLSTNVERLANKFGWSLNKDYGWLADSDYMINVPFPVVSGNDINSALTKLLVPYNGKITHKLLESNKQVYIVDAK
ncbi:TPA: hypothetical protein ACX6RO_001859 [Photobacterium damselae]